MKFKIYALTAITLAVIFFSGCKKEEVESLAKNRKTIVLMGAEDGGGGGGGGGDDGETPPSGPYLAANYDLSLASANNISVNVQAPFPPDTLHKVDIVDKRTIQRPLSDLMFSFKYYKANPTTISDFNFISATIAFDYSLAETASVTSIIHSQNTINIRFKMKQSFLYDGFPYSNVYWVFVNYNYYSESATVSYSKI